MKTVPERLSALASIYRERNAVYGDDYRRYGRVMLALFPDGITIKTEADLSRFGVLTQMLGKLGRYAANFKCGGHADSLDDLAVYAQILQLLDSEGHADFELPFPAAAPAPVQYAMDPPQGPSTKCEVCHGVGIAAGDICEECSGTGYNQLVSEDQPAPEAALMTSVYDPDTVSGLNRECPECGAPHFQLHKSHCSIPSQLEAALNSRDSNEH